MKSTLIWLWQLCWWKKILLVPLGGFCYFFITGIYVTFDPHKEQDACSFDNISNVEYRKILASMTYGLADLKQDYQSIKNNTSITFHFGEKIKRVLEKEFSQIDEFNRLIASTHAFMRNIGYSSYETYKYARIKNSNKSKLYYSYSMEYKMPSLKLNFLNFYGLMTRGPSTIFITIESHEGYKNPKIVSVTAHPYHVFLTNQISSNFEQIYICPQSLLKNQ